MQKQLVIALVLMFAFFPSISQAQSRSVGNVEEKPKVFNDKILDIPVRQWLGRRFIFLPKSKKLQEYGYKLYLSPELFLALCDANELQRKTCELKYDKFVGKVIKVIDIKYDNTVTFIEEESGRKIYAQAYDGYIDGIALLDDMNKAKKAWLGKTIYSKVKEINTYNEKTDKYGSVQVKIGEPLKVIDIWWGDGIASIGKLWLIVEKNNKQQGYIATTFSWTNIYSSFWTNNRPWEDYFFDFNPRQKYDWSNEIWELINNAKIKLGMNQEQVKLSWRKPKKINQDISQGVIREQWVYDNQYLYFKNGILTSIQNR